MEVAGAAAMAMVVVVADVARADAAAESSRRIFTVCSPIIGGPGRLLSGVALKRTGKLGAMNLPKRGKEEVTVSKRLCTSGAASA